MTALELICLRNFVINMTSCHPAHTGTYKGIFTQKTCSVRKRGKTQHLTTVDENSAHESFRYSAETVEFEL